MGELRPFRAQLRLGTFGARLTHNAIIIVKKIYFCDGGFEHGTGENHPSSNDDKLGISQS